jgi:hypothetical protein
MGQLMKNILIFLIILILLMSSNLIRSQHNGSLPKYALLKSCKVFNACENIDTLEDCVTIKFDRFTIFDYLVPMLNQAKPYDKSIKDKKYFIFFHIVDYNRTDIIDDSIKIGVHEYFFINSKPYYFNDSLKNLVKKLIPDEQRAFWEYKSH